MELHKFMLESSNQEEKDTREKDELVRYLEAEARKPKKKEAHELSLDEAVKTTRELIEQRIDKRKFYLITKDESEIIDGPFNSKKDAEGSLRINKTQGVLGLKVTKGSSINVKKLK